MIENKGRERLKGGREGNAAGDVKIFIDSIHFFQKLFFRLLDFSSLVIEAYEIRNISIKNFIGFTYFIYSKFVLAI